MTTQEDSGTTQDAGSAAEPSEDLTVIHIGDRVLRIQKTQPQGRLLRFSHLEGKRVPA